MSKGYFGWGLERGGCRGGRRVAGGEGGGRGKRETLDLELFWTKVVLPLRVCISWVVGVGRRRVE